MRSISYITGVFVLVLLLAGCRVSEPAFAHTVFNDAETTLCLGGLRGISGANGASADPGIVPRGETGYGSWEMPKGSPVGIPITIEGWCYGAAGEELAYLKLTRPYPAYTRAAIAIMAPTALPHTESDCLELSAGDVQRGALICVVADL